MDTIFQIESLDTFEKLSLEILKSLYYPMEAISTHLGPDVIEKAREEIRTNITECNFDMHKLVDTFHSRGWDEGRLNYFNKLMEQNWSQILVAMLYNYNSKYGESVVDFDWIVKYVFGTSELKTLKYPILQLILSTVKKSGQHNKVMYDVNKEVLLKLINILENV